MTIFETPRLLVRELTMDDLDFVAEMLAHPEVMRYWPRTYSREEAADWISLHRKRYETEGCGYWLAVNRFSREPIGQVGVLWQDLQVGRVPGIGYILHRPFWGQGYATEGSAGCLRYIFHKLKEKKAYCLIRPENEPSLRVAERLRLTLEGEEDYKGYRHLIFTKSAEEPIGGNFEEQPSPKEP